jgi:hypothetical protein
MNKFGGMKIGDPADEPKQTPQPAERPADKLNSRGWRLLIYLRRIIQRRRGSYVVEEPSQNKEIE